MILLGVARSSSSDKSYNIIVNEEGDRFPAGVLSCNCRGWAVWSDAKKARGDVRKCKHTDEWLDRLLAKGNISESHDAYVYVAGPDGGKLKLP